MLERQPTPPPRKRPQTTSLSSSPPMDLFDDCDPDHAELFPHGEAPPPVRDVPPDHTTRRPPPAISGYRAMWLIAAFDLPVDTRAAKTAYRRFRMHLLDEGFSMLQYSVYARFCGSEETATTHRRRLKRSLPDDGEIRLLSVTDRQFEKMEIFLGKKRVPTEQPPDQLELF